MSSMSDLDAVSVAIGVVVGAIIATVATTRGSGAKKPKEGFKSPKPVVYYWPMFGRGGASMRMLEEAGIDYEHKQEFGDIASVSSAFGAKGSAFAPPVVVDGSYVISQSTACALYVGKCCGFTKGMDESKAVQYLIDIVDTFEGGLNKAADSGPTLKEYLEGERFAKQVGNIDRSIKGPFYFGDSPTAPDFFLCNLLDWFDHMLLVRLKEEKGVDALGPFKKIQGVLNGIRNLESYKRYKGVPIIKDDFKTKDEVFKNY